MAVSISLFAHTRQLFANGDVSLADLKVMLRTGTSFNAAHVDVSDLAGSEVSGNGWTAGGESIDNAAVTTVNTNEAMLDGDDVRVTASGGSIGPATDAVIIDDNETPARLLFYIDFDGSQEAGVGTEMQVNWNADGIKRWTAP